MTKLEREALREYVGAVCQFSESQMTVEAVGLSDVTVEFGLPRRGVLSMSLDEYRQTAGARLNAADDRLRALGMLA